MNKTELDDLVPPPEDCRAAYEAGVIGDTTALVWRRITVDYGEDGEGIKYQWRVLDRVSSDVRSDVGHPCSAPTLAELLAMLPVQSEHSLNLRPECAYDVDSKKFCVGYQFRGEFGPVEVDQNPAAAALRLLVMVNRARLTNESY